MPIPKKKRKTAMKKPSPVLQTTPESTHIPSLPDDLMLSCLSRVSRLHYPILSLVSKRFRSILISSELYQTRSLLNRKEICLYVCLTFSMDPNPRWFSLCCKPNHTNKKKRKKSFVLATLPIPNSPPAHESGLVSVGSDIDNIGGPINESPSARVSVLDCQSHTWHEAPSMRVERNYPAVNVFDGKIYVAGGFEDSNSSNWMEVFDPKTQYWEFVSSPLGAERCKSDKLKSAVIEGKIYMIGNEGVVYKPLEDRWEPMGGLMNWELNWVWFSYCVIDNVVYSYYDGIKWFDPKLHWWKSVKGLVGLPKIAHYAQVNLADYGGKMAVLWGKYSRGNKKKVIWCAEIALERRDEDEICGNVEWCDGLHTVPDSTAFVKVIAATL